MRQIAAPPVLAAVAMLAGEAPRLSAMAHALMLGPACLIQRQHFEIIGAAQGIHWPDVDEERALCGTASFLTYVDVRDVIATPILRVDAFSRVGGN